MKNILKYISLTVLILLFCGCSDQNIQTKQKKQVQPDLHFINTATSVIPDLASSSLKIETEKEMDADKGMEEKYYKVVKIVDGDTIDVDIDGKTERVRMVGVNTPESVDPRKSVECFGIEASNKAKELLNGQEVKLEADATQTDRDKYNRLLRYVWRKDGLFYNSEIIKLGYAYEYTFDLPYKFQKDFKEAQRQAESKKLGLWADNACIQTQTGQNQAVSAPVEPSSQTKPQSSTQATPQATSQQNIPSSCQIKGNISSSKEKIYHVLGCGSYNKTVIDTGAGEKWFCTEGEALKAGWRKALNCP